MSLPSDAIGEIQSILRGLIAVNSVFTVISIALLIASAFIIRRARQKVAYSVLFFSTFLLFTTFVLDVARWGILLSAPGTSTSNVIIGLIATSDIFRWWSKAALFGNIVLFLQGRERGLIVAELTSMYGTRIRSFAIAVHCLLLVLIVSLGMASAGLVVTASKVLHKEVLDSDSVTRLFNNSFALRYATEAFLYLTTIDIVITVGLMYRHMRKLEVRDQITMYILRVTSPLYGLLMACLLDFTIIFSQPVARNLFENESHGVNYQRLRGVVLTSAVLVSSLLTSVIASLLWMSRKDWTMKKVETHHAELFPMPSS